MRTFRKISDTKCAQTHEYVTQSHDFILLLMAYEDTYSPPLSLAFIVLYSLSNRSDSGSLDVTGKTSIVT